MKKNHKARELAKQKFYDYFIDYGYSPLYAHIKYKTEGGKYNPIELLEELISEGKIINYPTLGYTTPERIISDLPKLIGQLKESLEFLESNCNTLTNKI